MIFFISYHLRIISVSYNFYNSFYNFFFSFSSLFSVFSIFFQLSSLMKSNNFNLCYFYSNSFMYCAYFWSRGVKICRSIKLFSFFIFWISTINVICCLLLSPNDNCNFWIEVVWSWADPTEKFYVLFRHFYFFLLLLLLLDLIDFFCTFFLWGSVRV